MIRLSRAPTRVDPTDMVFDQPLPPDLADHRYQFGRRLDLHALRFAMFEGPDGGATLLARGEGLDGWFRCDLPPAVVSNRQAVASQRMGPLQAGAGDVTVRIDWTRPSTFHTRRRLEWVRSDDPTPREVRGVLGLTERITAGDRVLMKSSPFGMRVADDIDATDLAMVLVTPSLFG